MHEHIYKYKNIKMIIKIDSMIQKHDNNYVKKTVNRREYLEDQKPSKATL